jgi:tetratricopeptide (TPR) repeat protein
VEGLMPSTDVNPKSWRTLKLKMINRIFITVLFIFPIITLGQDVPQCEQILETEPSEPTEDFERLKCVILTQDDLNQSLVVAGGLLAASEGFDEAYIGFLTNLIEDYPDSAILYAERAHAYTRLDENLFAESDVNTALALEANVGAEYYYALEPNMTTLVFPEAQSHELTLILFEYAEWAIALSPDAAEVYQLRGVLFSQMVLMRQQVPILKPR